MTVAVRETLERELKFTVPESFTLPELPGEALDPRVFTSTYYDTEPRALAAGGITLRWRVENGRGLWQLKFPRGDARLELERPGGPLAPPPELQELLPAVLEGGKLEAVATLRTRRHAYVVRDGERAVAEVAQDSVAALEGLHVTNSFEELEVELLEGTEDELRDIERALVAAGAERSDGRPKVFRVIGGAPVAADDKPPLGPAHEGLRAFFAAQHAELLEHDPGTRLGSDPEELHDFRVATRRLRSVLRSAGPLLAPDWSVSLRDELAWLGDCLGAVRDLDVFNGYLRDEITRLEPEEQAAAGALLEALAAEREAAREGMLEALRSERYLALLRRLEEAGRAPQTVPADLTLPEVAAQEFRRLRRAMRAFEADGSDEELHRARIRGKRGRYAAELAGPKAGKREKRFVERAKAFQDVIGEHQDAVVAEARIRELLTKADGGELTAFAAGRLVEHQRARRREARQAVPQAWRRLEQSGRRAWS